MSVTEGQVIEGWKAMGKAHETWKQYPVLELADGREVALAVDLFGRRHLLVPADDPMPPLDPNSPLSVTSLKIKSDRPGSTGIDEFLDIQCELPHLNEQFDKVVLDVLQAVEESHRPAHAAAAQLSSWRKLFSTLAGGKSLSYQQKIAVFGELSVLEKVIQKSDEFDPEWWTGPSRDPHDFELPNASLEVKTVTEESATVHMHGFDQLEPLEDKPLHLVLQTVEESSQGQTIAQLVSDIAQMTDGDEKVLAKMRTLGVGSGEEDSVRFRVVNTAHCQVEDDFPRISAETLPASTTDAVVTIEYELELEALQQYLEGGTVEDLLQEVRLS